MQNKLETWMADLFMPALDWVLQRQKHLVIETTKVGIVNNALSYLTGCTTKAAFTYGVILGLGSNFKYELRKEFTTTIMSQAGERGSDPNVLLNYFDSQKQAWGAFIQEPQTFQFQEFHSPEAPPLVLTPAIQKDIAVIKPLLERNESFVLCGPEGCGKNLIVTSLIKQMKSTQMAVIHCNAQTSATAVIQKLNAMCAQSTNSQGRVYRPKECQRLIIYLKDINLPQPDKYDTIQLISFLQQIVCYQGFYDTNLDFVSMERITIVASMNPSTTIGRHRISSRFTANVKLAYMDYASQEELLPVYNLYLKTVLGHPRLGGGKLAGSTRRLASFLIDVFGEVKQRFSVDDHRHYLFTPRMVTTLIFQLLRYEIPDAGPLIASLVYESQRVYRDRLVDRPSKKAFDQILFKHVQNDLKFPVNKLDDVYFLSKITQGQESALPGIPNMGRIPRQDYMQLID
jgi:dynein heavy chain 2